MVQPIGTCVLVLDKTQKKVLLGVRKNAYQSGIWGTPGGRLEVGEDVREAAKRELREETGLIAEDIPYLGVIKQLHDGYDFVHFAFVCKEFSGTLETKEPEKCAGWEWRDLKKLPINILPGHRAAIELYLQKPRENLVSI